MVPCPLKAQPRRPNRNITATENDENKINFFISMSPRALPKPDRPKIGKPGVLDLSDPIYCLGVRLSILDTSWFLSWKHAGEVNGKWRRGDGR